MTLGPKPAERKVTVRELAAELGTPLPKLLGVFDAAGVKPRSGEDPLSAEEAALLCYYQELQRPSNAYLRARPARKPLSTLRAEAATKFVVVDASNVAYGGPGRRIPRLENLTVVRDQLIDAGYPFEIIADAALRHSIDEKAAYEILVRRGDVTQAPAGTDADVLILKRAKERNGFILSNDRFQDHFIEVADPDASSDRSFCLRGFIRFAFAYGCVRLSFRD